MHGASSTFHCEFLGAFDRRRIYLLPLDYRNDNHWQQETTRRPQMDAIVGKPPLTQGQLHAVASVPPHTGKDFPVFSGSVAASVYLDPARFALERQRIFRRYPLPVTVSALLPEPK